jgi:hypothetical protein
MVIKKEIFSWLNSTCGCRSPRQGFEITDTRHSVDSSGRVISPWQRPLPDNIQHSQETDIGGIRTHYPSKRLAEDPRLKRHSCRHQLKENLLIANLILIQCLNNKFVTRKLHFHSSQLMFENPTVNLGATRVRRSCVVRLRNAIKQSSRVSTFLL